MILFINTADTKKVFIGLIKKNELIGKKEFFAQYQQAEKLLAEINSLLKIKDCKPKDLQAIIVICGPGPFTALRIGIVVANTLSWALKIPVVGMKLTEFKDIDDLIKKSFIKLHKIKIGDIIEPFYGKEPNITKRKLI